MKAGNRSLYCSLNLEKVSLAGRTEGSSWNNSRWEAAGPGTGAGLGTTGRGVSQGHSEARTVWGKCWVPKP